jgi:hypothetical protein
LGKKKCNLNDIFLAKKGTLLPEKGHFGKLGGTAPPCPPVPTPLNLIAAMPSDVKPQLSGHELYFKVDK